MSAPRLHVLIMAGGTGGHVMPGLAVAGVLRSRGCQVSWLGTAQGLEDELVPRAGLTLHHLHVAGLRGGGAWRWLLAPPRLARALGEALRLLRRLRPDVVLGMGGYASGPGGLAAWLMRRPLVIHEQNAVAGLTNRILAHFATCVLEAFPASFPAGAARHVGNPVRAEIARVANAEPASGRALRLLVLGGSQGARALNEHVPAAVAALPDDRPVTVVHQCGARHAEAARAAYRAHGLQVVPVPYIDDMAGAYAAADLVICRAGAMTVCEVAAAGRAALLIPFPYAVDDHQHANARYLANAGAAVIVTEDRFAAGALAVALGELLAEPARLACMGRRARGLARTDAAAAVAEVCLEVCHG